MESAGLLGGVLGYMEVCIGYMVECRILHGGSIGLHDGECWVTWWGVELHSGDCWVALWGVLGYMMGVLS